MYTLHGDMGDALNWAFAEHASLADAMAQAVEAALWQATHDLDIPCVAIVVCDADMVRVHSAPVNRSPPIESEATAMATNLSLTYCGMLGEGAGVREAKANAAIKLASLVDGVREAPCLVDVHGCVALVWRGVETWDYRIVCNDARIIPAVERGGPQQIYGNTGEPTKVATVARAAKHALQVIWSHAVSDDRAFCESGLSPHIRGADLARAVNEACDYFAWQRRYKLARDNGASDSDAHRMASENR